ncbi:ABC transporter permease [Streptomyces sp. NPDC004629]|uniref:ABC transporter permease n=1 Tax=Streptomyces sp. NPDC004629 TaxID=3364705 RepID=UPI0036C076F4
MLGNIFTNTLLTGLPLIPVCLGVYLVLRIRQDFDLTVEGSFTLGGATAAVLISHGLNPIPAMATGIAAGAAAGLLTSLVSLTLRQPVLLAGLIVNMGLYSVTLGVLGSPTVSLLGAGTIFSGFDDTADNGSQTTRIMVLAVIAMALLAAFAVFLKTEVGLALRASGENPRMVRSQGVNENGLTVLSLMLSNGLSALGGTLLVQVQSYADVNMGTGMFLAGTGSVLLGVLLFSPSGSQVVRIVAAVMAGGLLYRLILVAALRFGLPANNLNGITALTLIVTVAAQSYVVPVIGKYRRSASRRAAGLAVIPKEVEAPRA